ncbi:uncharacterized protein LOC126819427 isoform X2 [Patella vulgata]|uniref:uncharacterized protein LOC126819427 isoform X2 n=1 Tax=Patella vulgata TaxID=6465 RepID=UPI0021805EE0|nr:uncharacterized protein LOC126819427 isoform X2 [Patella vulgata]
MVLLKCSTLLIIFLYTLFLVGVSYCQTVSSTEIVNNVSNSYCDDGWVQYNVSVCVQFRKEPEYFSEAKDACSRQGGTLVTPNTKEFNMWLVDRFSGSGLFWIGIERLGRRVLKFLNNQPIEWSNWDTYYHPYSGASFCAYLKKSGKWSFDRQCNVERQREFVCQKDAVCFEGKYGKNCDESCHCHGKTCDISGICLYGCERGWTGTTCSQAIYYCMNSKTDGKYMLLRIVPRGTHYGDIIALNNDGEPVKRCRGSTFTTNPLSGERSRRVDAYGKNTCGVTKISSNVFEWRFYLQEMEGVLSEFDEVLTLTCDFSQADTLSVQQQGAVGGLLQAGTRHVEATKEEISLNIIDPFSKKSLSEVVIGTNVVLQVILKKQTGISAKGISVFGCTARNSNGSLVKNLIDSKGCQLPSSTVFLLEGYGLTVTSAPFPIFTFPGSQVVIFTCNYEYCFNEGDLRCMARCAYLSEDHRRRREANGTSSNKSTSASITVHPCKQSKPTVAENTVHGEHEAWIYIHPVTCGVFFLLLVVVFSLVVVLIRKSSTDDIVQTVYHGRTR